MIDCGFLVVITTLVMVLIALIRSFDLSTPPRDASSRRTSARAVELPPFGLPWLGLYDGLDVAEHLRRELRPAKPTAHQSLAPRQTVGPYR
jgi:hypothetical protein